MKPYFTVNESVDDETVSQAMRDLRRMIRYGRMAERAMKSLKEDGFYDGLTPLADPPERNFAGQYSQGKKKSDVRFARLPARLPISRDDLGSMSELRLEFGKIESMKYAGNSCKEVDIFIAGPMAFQIASALPKYEIREDTRRIGAIRINKGHLSWLENSAHGYGHGSAHRIYKEMRYPGAKDSLTAFSRGVSRVLVKLNTNTNTTVFAAKTLELQATAWEWFLADGHAERFFLEFHDMTRIAEVMDS